MAAEDWFDEYDWDGFDGEEPRELACRRCGSHDVYWAESRGKWVLYNVMNSRRHVCDKAEVTERNLAAFDEI